MKELNTQVVNTFKLLFTRDLIAFIIADGDSEESAFRMSLSSEALLTNGCCRSWPAEGRSSGSLCKQSLTKSFPSSDKWSGIVGSSLLFPILNIAATLKQWMWNSRNRLFNQCFVSIQACAPTKTRIFVSENRFEMDMQQYYIHNGYNISSNSLTPSYWPHGGFVVAISKTVQPRLHMSTARLQPFEFFITYIIEEVTQMRLLRTENHWQDLCGRRNHTYLRCHPVRTSFKRKWKSLPSYLQNIPDKQY